MNSKAMARSRQAVIILDRNNPSGWNLHLMLQVAGCQVYCVSSLAEGLNMAHTARETGVKIACLVGRAQQFSIEELEQYLMNSEKDSSPLPLVLLKPHDGYSEEIERLRRYCGVRLWSCLPFELLETIQPFIEKNRNSMIETHCERKRMTC